MTARRQRLLKQFETTWLAFKDSYAGLPEAVLLEPGVTKAWSVKDIIAHVTTWEEEALKHLPGILEGRKPPRYSVTPRVVSTDRVPCATLPASDS
jgi:hypothetical protein